MSKTSDFLTTTDWEYKEGPSNQYIVKICPFCFDDRWKFYIRRDDSGLFDCKLCQESGNLYQLKTKMKGVDQIGSTQKMFSEAKELESELADEYFENLKKDKTALTYLIEKRNFKKETIKHFKLGVNDDWIMIPHFQDGKLWNFKMRNYVKKEFKRITGQPSVLFNIDNIDFDKKNLVIVESETDCIAAWQMGITNVVGLTTGAGTFAPEWISTTLKFEKIYLCLNSDLAGEKGAKKIAEKIGFEKCYHVALPTKDVNDFLIEDGDSEKFKQILKEAKKIEVENISNVSKYIEKIDDWFSKDGAISGLDLPFRNIDSFLNGFKAEDLVVLSGDTGVGKTTICLNFMHHFIKNNHRCLGFFLEGKIMYYISRMMSMESHKKIEELREDDEEWAKLKKRFSSYPLFFYSGAQSDLTPEKLTDLLKIATKHYDIDYVMIDNLQKFVKDKYDVVKEISRTVSILKDLAVDLQIPILLITHIRKPERHVRRISMHDAKSSSTIYQDADIYLTLWNDKKNEEDDDNMMLSISKNRMGEGGKDQPMIFEKEYGIFREREKEFDEEPKKKRKAKLKIENDEDVIEL
jgi:twinkle protein